MFQSFECFHTWSPNFLTTNDSEISTKLKKLYLIFEKIDTFTSMSSILYKIFDALHALIVFFFTCKESFKSEMIILINA